MDVREITRVVGETNKIDQEKLVEDIVKKLRDIGDELEKNSKVRTELSLIISSSLNIVLYNCLKENLHTFASLLQFF